ncbi:MAG: PLP-dependent aminotransferase family protein [Mycolicibacterium neoaurum]|uniref:aminotransferase-like domain-containing protein n=1 Tax=Mycolicibacterium neoaurum TaxID=1795 RepID=UPI002FFAA135
MRPATYKQIVDRYAGAIRRGELTSGTKLPAHRTLAREHGIALATASRVYAELTAMGLVVGEPGRGTFVRDQSGYAGIDADRRLPSDRLADLSFNQPRADATTTMLRDALRHLSTSGNLESILYQQPAGGRRHERAVVATHLLDRAIDVTPDSVFLTNGAQQALDVALITTTRPGDVIAADALTYPGLKLLAAARALEIVPIPVRDDGTDLVGLDRLCATRSVRAAYLMPTVHNPLGWTLDSTQRAHLVEIARRHDTLLIEDGTYAFLDVDAPAALQTMAPERTFYLAGLSKSVATGLRFGYLVAPKVYAAGVTSSLRATGWGVPSVVTALATGWIADGTVARLETVRRDDARARQDIARNALRGLAYRANPASMFGWLELPGEVRADLAAAHLARAGILVSTADAFDTTGHWPHALRLALATAALDDLGPVLDTLRTTVLSVPW